MKILYLSCHEVLHFDECSLLIELGHEVFCPGAYVCSENKGDTGIRPGLPKCENYDSLMEEWHTFGKEGKDNKESISVEFFKKFDLVINMHIPLWISSNWERLKKSGTPMVLRTIGQNVASNESQIAKFKQEGLKIIRYSPKEKLIPGYVGEDAMIRFYKDQSEFSGWTGEKESVISFAQSMQRRGAPCNFKWFEDVTEKFPRKLYGAESETLSYGKGRVPYSELKSALREHRGYIYTGTWPASVCLNYIEAAMTGIPIVAVGPKLGHPFGWFAGHPLYEIGDIIENGVNGFCSDSMEESKNFISLLLRDHSFAKKIGDAGRETAIKLFGKETIKKQWQDFLKLIR